jgi:hypothetical protein
MIIESGAIIFLGLLFLAWKLPPSKILLLLSYPMATDLGCSALAFVMHYGTFSGVMAAAVAGLMCSAMTAFGRKAVGYKADGVYVPGFIDWSRYA